MTRLEQVSLSTAGGARASVLVGAGNTLVELSAPGVAGGRNLIHFPDSPADYAGNSELAGNPLLFPWANRLADRTGYSFAGKRVEFPPGEPPVYLRDDHGLPLHGLLTKSRTWSTVTIAATTHLARHEWSTDHPHFACYPFAHVLEMRHTLRDCASGPGAVLEIELGIQNTNTVPRALPLAFGFHPYLAGGSSARTAAFIDLPLRGHIQTDERLIPNGRLQPLRDLWPDHRNLQLRKDLQIDHGFTGLLREADGHRPLPLVLRTPDREVAVRFGPEYRVAVVYAPVPEEGQEYFVCFEPMLAPTNALAQTPALENSPDDEWPGIAVLAAGQSLQVSFEIEARPRGAN